MCVTNSYTYTCHATPTFYQGCDWWEKGGHQSFYEVWRSRYLSELGETFVEPLKELDQIHDIVMEIISILLQKTTTKIITKCEWNSLAITISNKNKTGDYFWTFTEPVK